MPMHTSPCSGASAEDWKNAMHTDNAQKRGKPFALGNRSGKGRPVGSRNKAKLLLEAMMEGGAVAVGQKFMELVQNGNVPVMKSEERRVGKECRSRWSPYH